MLSWYKSTNTDAESLAKHTSSASSAGITPRSSAQRKKKKKKKTPAGEVEEAQVLNLLALLVKKYKY